MRVICTEIDRDGVSNIKIDEIREVLSQVSNSTEISYAFRNLDNLTTQSQNALLKVLEECPPYVKFFLLCEDPNKVLQTIKSRCNLYKMRLYTHDEIEEYVREGYPNIKKIDLLENYCMGILGRVDRLAGKRFKDIRDKAIMVYENVGKISLSNVFNIVKHLDGFKEDLDLFLDTLLTLFNDTHLVKCGLDKSIVDYLLLEKYKASEWTIEECYRNVKIIDKYKRMSNANVNFTMFVDNLMLSLRGEI
jgi:DNA polymerase-3 subunit delta'